ncbi:hypothetical protein AB0H28_15280 [Micromonospora sp. NPDC050980]|uniref:hypothetical protein n=1 Tax=Micromonospora sp. NPDC050980 TaxID=3155161 RepID=UPI0034118CF5
MLIAGAVPVTSVMAELGAERSLFHSEADFQHAFAWTVRRLDGSIRVRLEVRQEQNEHLDLLCHGPGGRTAVEVKYFTARWNGVDPRTGEEYGLRHHAAADVLRHRFVADIERLERFRGAGPAGANGLAVLLTNDQGLWRAPVADRPTRDREFRLHEGRRLTGVLRWGLDGRYFLPNERHLSGDYRLDWRDFTRLPGRTASSAGSPCRSTGGSDRMCVQARQETGRTVGFLRSLAERRYDRVWTPAVLRGAPDVQGFAVLHHGALSLVFGAAVHDDPPRCLVRMACAAGADVSDLAEATVWADIRNQLTDEGHYHCVATTDRSACHVVFTRDVRRPLAEDVTAPGSRAVRDLLDGALAACVYNARADHRDLSAYLAARPLEPTEADVRTLFDCARG